MSEADAGGGAREPVGRGRPRSPDEAVHALIRNEIKVEKRIGEGAERIFRFLTGRRHGLGWFLPRYLRAIGPRWPDELLTLWCSNGRCLVDGQIVGPEWQVVPGRQVELRIAPLPDEGHAPPPLALLWHDRHVVFANKPTGQLAHQAGKQLSGTLLNQLQDWATTQGIDPNEVRLINRIDRETSGIVIATCDLAAHQRLAAQLDERTIRKAYRAICVGVPTPGDGDWREPLGPLGEHTIRRGVLADGQASHTEIPRRRGRRRPPPRRHPVWNCTPAASTRSASTPPITAIRWSATGSMASRSASCPARPCTPGWSSACTP